MKIANRPPHTVTEIQLLTENGEFQAAQNAADKCELYFAAKVKQAQGLFLAAERAKRAKPHRWQCTRCGSVIETPECPCTHEAP